MRTIRQGVGWLAVLMILIMTVFLASGDGGNPARSGAMFDGPAAMTPPISDASVAPSIPATVAPSSIEAAVMAATLTSPLVAASSAIPIQVINSAPRASGPVAPSTSDPTIPVRLQGDLWTSPVAYMPEHLDHKIAPDALRSRGFL